MLYELARWLQQLESLFGLFNYQTFRAILAALTALFLSLWLGPAMIRKLAQFKGGQPIRKDGPQTHFSKAGTPTMGGSLILLTITLSVLMWADLRNRYVWLVLAVMLAVGLRPVLWKLLLVVILQWCTSPLSGHMLAQFEYRVNQNLEQHLELPDGEQEAGQ